MSLEVLRETIRKTVERLDKGEKRTLTFDALLATASLSWVVSPEFAPEALGLAGRRAAGQTGPLARALTEPAR
jgi:hypothetical protein